MFQLVHRKIARCAAAKVNEIRFPPAHERFCCVKRKLLERRLDVASDGGRVLVRVHLEIAKMTALTAKRNMQINSQRRNSFRWPLQCSEEIRNGVSLPKRKGRVV